MYIIGYLIAGFVVAVIARLTICASDPINFDDEAGVTLAFIVWPLFVFFGSAFLLQVGIVNSTTFLASKLKLKVGVG